MDRYIKLQETRDRPLVELLNLPQYSNYKVIGIIGSTDYPIAYLEISDEIIKTGWVAPLSNEYQEGWLDPRTGVDTRKTVKLKKTKE